MWGGPAHLDTFDPKPDAGRDYCGAFTRPLATNADGIRIDPLAGVPADTLLTEGGMWNGFGWSVTVDARWRVTVAQAGA